MGATERIPTTEELLVPFPGLPIEVFLAHKVRRGRRTNSSAINHDDDSRTGFAAFLQPVGNNKIVRVDRYGMFTAANDITYIGPARARAWNAPTPWDDHDSTRMT
jgi:hypothetical protein